MLCFSSFEHPTHMLYLKNLHVKSKLRVQVFKIMANVSVCCTHSHTCVNTCTPKSNTICTSNTGIFDNRRITKYFLLLIFRFSGTMIKDREEIYELCILYSCKCRLLINLGNNLSSDQAWQNDMGQNSLTH